MKLEDWQRLDFLVEEALERPPEERPDYLDEACAGEETLRREVDSLLAVDAAAEGFLEVPAGLAASAAGERIGPYRIERMIGSGGMGVVYLASRADDAYQGKVAIKLLQAGSLVQPSLIRRFHGERQILASLAHPAIARLLDGGTTDDGRPYLVMAYIDGLPIDEYCDNHRLSVRQRLELFREVCAAVHYAHQNLVVHRDLKPSNILITTDGTPRLLDFGIAKLLDPERFPITVEATTGLRPMTPHYASPEQARGGTITTASDVFSLGVLLYRLLAGRMPHRVAGLSAVDLERALTDSEPLKPSAAVSAGAGAPESGAAGAPEAMAAEEICRRRGVRPVQLRRRLAGDLDNIVAKALRVEPSRRYGSVEQLSEDLRRHLVGLPVLARPDAFGYRLAKFLRRNRLPVAVAAVGLVLVLIFAGAMARQATLTARQRDLAEQQRAQAEQQRQRAERVSGFLVEMFEGLNPWQGSGVEVTAREVLERGVDKVEQELPDHPEVRASLQDAIGTVYVHLGLYDDAAPLLEAALATREALLAGDREQGHDLDVAESLGHLAELQRHRGRYGEAEALCQRALSIRERALGSDHPAVAEMLRLLASLNRSQGRYAEAEEAGARALGIYRQSFGPEHAEVAATLLAMAGTAARKGERERAQWLLEEALAIDEKVLGPVHPETASVLYNLGNVRLEFGATAEAQVHFERVLASWREALGEVHPNVAAAHLGLASVARMEGRPVDEERHLKHALELYEQTVGADHPFVAACLFKLGRLQVRLGRSAEAAPLLERSLAIRERRLGADHPWTGETLCGLAELGLSQGRVAESVALCRRIRAIWEQHPGHSGLAEMPGVCSAVYLAAGRVSEASEIAGLGPPASEAMP